MNVQNQELSPGERPTDFSWSHIGEGIVERVLFEQHPEAAQTTQSSGGQSSSWGSEDKLLGNEQDTKSVHALSVF